MSTIQGPTQKGPVPIDPGRDITSHQMKTIGELIAKFIDEKNTKVQTDVVGQIWDNLRPAMVARYMVIPPDDVVAEYIAPAPGMPMPIGYEPDRFAGATGDALVAAIDGRERGTPTDANGAIIPDEMVMYYLVAPPPPPDDPVRLGRFNKLHQFDVDMNKTFGALLESAKSVIADGKIQEGELKQFEQLHYSFDLCAKLFYDDLREYIKDYPFSDVPDEPPGGWRNFSGAGPDAIPDGPKAPASSADPSSVLGVQSTPKTKK